MATDEVPMLSNISEVTNLHACIQNLEEFKYGPEDAIFFRTTEDHLKCLPVLSLCFDGSKVQLSTIDAERVLKICIKYILDERCLSDLSTVVTTLLDIDQVNKSLDFIPFGISLMKLIKECPQCKKKEALQLFMKLPKRTLEIIIGDCAKEIINTLKTITQDLSSQIETFKLLAALEWLRPYEKKVFVEAGLSYWFSDVIPAMVSITASAEDDNIIKQCLTYTEMLVNEIVEQNYGANDCWQNLKIRMTNPEEYPADMLNLLQHREDYWHRILIVFIKLLKSQVTQNVGHDKPLTAMMLPVIELAFKKDEAQKVRAFACWKELIEHLCHETIESRIKKSVKLLTAPLHLRNTKTEETAMAKLQTWCHMIKKFKKHIENHAHDILICFLYFMFGKHNEQEQKQANQFSYELKRTCVEAFEEIMQINCAITNIKGLDGNITMPILLDYWQDFVYGLKSCIVAVSQNYTKCLKIKIACIWISFVSRLAVKVEQALRHNITTMFQDLLNMLAELLNDEKIKGNKHITEILVDDIYLPLWRDNKLKVLLQSSETHRPMHKIIKHMHNECNEYFENFNGKELKRCLQPLVGTMLEESILTGKPETIHSLWNDLLVTKYSMMMWTALAQASKDSELCLEAFNVILIWPFKNLDASFEVKEAAQAWYTLYSSIHENLEETNFDNDFSKALARIIRGSEISTSSTYFVLFALVGILKHKPDETKIERLEALTFNMNIYNDLQLLLSLYFSIMSMINNLTDENLAQKAMNSVTYILLYLPENNSDQSSTENNTLVSDTMISTLKSYLEKCPYQCVKTRLTGFFSDYNTKSSKQVSESQSSRQSENIQITSSPSPLDEITVMDDTDSLQQEQPQDEITVMDVNDSLQQEHTLSSPSPDPLPESHTVTVFAQIHSNDNRDASDSLQEVEEVMDESPCSGDVMKTITFNAKIEALKSKPVVVLEKLPALKLLELNTRKAETNSSPSAYSSLKKNQPKVNLRRSERIAQKMRLLQTASSSSSQVKKKKPVKNTDDSTKSTR